MNNLILESGNLSSLGTIDVLNDIMVIPNPDSGDRDSHLNAAILEIGGGLSIDDSTFHLSTDNDVQVGGDIISKNNTLFYLSTDNKIQVGGDIILKNNTLLSAQRSLRASSSRMEVIAQGEIAIDSTSSIKDGFPGE